MEWIDPVFVALNSGVEIVVSAAVALLAVYVTYYLSRLGIPRVLLQPIADDAVRAVEERFTNEAKQAIARGEAYIKPTGHVKLQQARAAVRRAVPNWLLSDAQVDDIIDAALVRAGHGAAGAITFGVERVVDALDSVEAPGA